MSGDGGSTLGSAAQLALGGFGMIQSYRAASRQEDVLRGAQRAAQQQRGRVEPIFEYFLGGGRAQDLNIPGFAEQFAEVDAALQEEQRRIDAQFQNAQQQIMDAIPQQRGARVRALAELARKKQDLKAAAARRAIQRKHELDVTLTNDYLKAALGYAPGGSQEALLAQAQRSYDTNLANLAALGQYVGSALGPRVQQQPMVNVYSGYPSRPPVAPYSTLARQPSEFSLRGVGG